jgi:hypothetical protein
MTTYLRDCLIAFALTLVIEVTVALLLGYRRRLEIAAVVCVNLFTHPLLCYLVWLIIAWQSAPLGVVEIAILEAGVVLVEWQLLCYALRQHPKSRLFALSLAMNAASYVAGLLVL